MNQSRVHPFRFQIPQYIVYKVNIFHATLKKQQDYELKMLDKLKDNSRYDSKSVRLKPETYLRLVKAKARLEFEKEELHSFDGLIDFLVKNYLDDTEIITNSLNVKEKLEEE